MSNVASASHEKPTSGPTHSHLKMLWLFVGHIAVGLTGAFVTWLAGPSPTVWGYAFFGIVFGQTSLLGIWGGLGTNRWWIRLIGVVVGIGYLFPLLGIGIHELNGASLFVVLIATMFVTLVFLFVRFFRVAIHLDSRPVASTGHIQFSIRHLMILTFVIACLITIGRAVQPFFPHGEIRFVLLLLSVTGAIVGIFPVWFILATKRPVLYGVGLVAVGTSAGYCIGQVGMFDDLRWMITTGMEAMVVAISLLAIRSCGYRLMRLPPRC